MSLKGLIEMAVIDWLCDCCGAHLGIDDGRVMFMKRIGIAEDRCESCISHMIHCMKRDENAGE